MPVENSKFVNLLIKNLNLLNSELKSINFNFSEMAVLTDKTLKKNNKNTTDIVRSSNNLMESNIKAVINNIHILDQTLQQINCDSKDVNQNLHKLTSFLGEIEKHLKLK